MKVVQAPASWGGRAAPRTVDVDSPPRARLVATTTLPTRHGPFSVGVFHHDDDDRDHLVIHRGDVGGHDLLVRVHSECFTGEVLGSLMCDCAAQLDDGLRRIAECGRGLLIYLRQEGRGIGLSAKLRAYALQAEGADTVEANLALGLPVDARRYEAAAAALRMLEVGSIRLLTNNPDKLEQLRHLGIDVRERVATVLAPNEHNLRYLKCKSTRMGHRLALEQAASSSAVVDPT